MGKKQWKKTTAWMLTAAVCIGSLPVIPGSTAKAAEDAATEDGFILYDGQSTTPVFLDAAYTDSEEDTHAERSYEQVKRAVGDFRQDVAMVTGAIDATEVQQIMNDSEELQEERLKKADQKKVPELYTGDYEQVKEDYAVLVGTIGDSDLIDTLIGDGKLDEAKTIEGNWESYVIKEVENPLPGVEKGLVIAGSDARGTIYGIYEISENIGVSPFYWYSDVPVETKDEIVVDDYETAEVNDGPDVKYRGIFINDEDISILNWAAKKFEDNEAPGLHYYRHVFELMLRLKCNFLWPAMHEVSDAFNTATDENGIPVDSKEAARYGIVMGSSHCEILLRANTSEWVGWYAKNKDKYHMQGNNAKEAYDFSRNEEGILQYWRERLETNKDFESILTLGIRGVHDGAFRCANLSKYEGNTNDEKKVSFMKDVIKKQRQLIAEVYLDGDMSRIAEVPQVLIPYKEMGTVYNNGLNKFMAQEEYRDVTLMWAEDNFGYVRQVPTSDEASRSGGTGIYYHSSYWGTPSCYLWLNSTPLAQMSEELHKAYDAGMRNQWVLNVGDIKPGDQALEFYAKMAWDMESYDDKTVKENFQIPQAMRDYHMDQQTAEEVADCMEEYNSIIAVKKTEFYTIAGGAYPMSATADGDEALKWLQRCQKVTDRMTAVYEKLAPEYQTAFYEQMYYHVLSMNDAAREYVFYWKAQQAAKQGRVGSLKIYTQLSKMAANTIRTRVEDYNSLNNNKWTGYMSWKHVASSGSEDYSHDIIQTSEYPTLSEEGEGIGAAAEGMETAGSGTLLFDSLSGDVRYFDVFSKQNGSVSWCAKTSADWIKLSKTKGNTATEERVTAEIDWSKVSGTQSGTITVYNADENGNEQGNAVATFEVKAENRSGFDYGNQKGYTEANGYVMLEAEHYSQQIAGSDGSIWEVIKNNGQRGDTMKAMPNTAAYTEDYANTAKLVYHVYFKKAGTVNGTLYRLPTLNEGTDDNGNARSCRIGIGTGSATPVILRGNTGWQEMYSYNNPSNTWAQNIMRMYEPLNFTLKVSEGWNDIVLYRMNAAMVVDRILLRTENGAVKDSLQGPDESPNNIAQLAKVSVAEIPEEVADAIFHADMKVNIADGKTVYPEDIKVTSASSAEKRVAEVEVKEGKLSVIPKMAGKAEISVTTESETFTFEVIVEPDKNAEGAYQETDGQAVMLASDALAQSGEAFTAAGTENHTFGLNGIGIKVQPDNGATWTDGSMSGLNGKAPAATYKVQISTAGTYRLYVNTSNPDVNADSYHVAVDGNFVYTDKNDNGGGTAAGKETWYGGNKTINLTAGEHTITIFAREDGFTLNQLCLTTGNKPSGLFEKSSERVTAEIPDDVSVRAEAEDAYRLSDGMTLDGVWENADAGNKKWLKTVAAKEQAAVQITVDIPKDGMYHIETRYRADASGRATVQTTADEKKVGTPFSMNGTSGTYATADCGSISLTKGTHTISYKVADNAGTTLGLDYVVLTRTGDAKEEPVVSPDTDYEVLVQSEAQTFTDGTKDNTAAAVRFPAEVQKQDAVEVSFDWTSKITTSGGKAGLTFRDAYGRLIFAVATAYKNGFELRYTTDGGRLDDEKIADWYEPVWNSAAATANTVYTIHLKADFTNRVLSYDITEKASGKQLVKAENVQMDAANLAAMTACSYYTSNRKLKTAQQVENFVIRGTEEKELPLKGKTLYAFGDSIVYGHKYNKASFPNFVAAMEGMTFTNAQKFAANGATILASENQILSQIKAAPEEAPDYVVLDGGINDAYDTLKEAEFTAAFEETLQTIKDKWPTAKILYVSVHKTNTREAAYQETVHRLALESCDKMQIKVADLYAQEGFDCLNDSENVKKYAFDEVGANGLPISKGKSATHPNLDAIEAFYVPVVSEALRDLARDQNQDWEEMLEKAEAESLKYTTNGLATRVSSGDANASGSAFLAIDSSKVGDYIEFEVDVPDYITSAKIVTGYKTKNNRGNLRLSVNGTDYGQPIVMAANEEKYVVTEAGEEIKLKAGEKNKFRYTVTKGGVLCLDYIGLYYKADISRAGLLTDAVLGEMPKSPSEASGTDDHTAVVHSLDKDTRTVTSYVRKEVDLSALQVTFSLRRSEAKILLDGETFNNGDKADFSQGDRIFEFQYGDYTEKWIVKQPAIAYNAVLPGQYSDPDIDILDGKFWIFPTTDGTADWGGTQFHAFSSEDLVNWKDEGVIVDLAAEESYKNENNVDVAVVPWASGHAWAPSIEEKDGKYYFYFCGQWEGSKETVMGRRQAIGVAVADNPAGPYKVMDHPLITREEWFQAINRTSGGQCIDPSIFKDDDGTYYLMFGNGIPSVAQLGEDMQSIVPGTIKTLSGLTNFTESVVVNKINGKYHFTWTCNDTGSPDYCVRYGTADSVYGPVNSRGILLQKDVSGDMLGTGHQSILRNGNDYYIAYHRFYTPLGVYTEGLGYHRETCIEKLSFDNDGYFNVLSPTMEGPGEAVPYNAELKNSLTQAEEILKEKDQYEEAGVQKLEEAIKKAKEVYADYYATVEMVNQSVKELKDTATALVPKDLDVAERAEAVVKVAKEAADAAETAAKTAESTKEEAVKAADEAKAAKAEAEAAKAAAETAKVAAEKAKQEAEAAKTAADSDKAVAEAAAQRAESAESAAKAAQEKAETAQTKAEEAGKAAQMAKTNAETAENNAKTAQSKAETAAEAAKDAKDAAELAKTDAVAAKTKAEEAQQKAETAKDAAVTAKDAAEEAKDKAEAAAEAAKDAKEAAEAASSAAKAQEDLAKAYAEAAEASAEKAIASAETAKASVAKAEEAYKKAEEKLAQVQKEAEEKLAKMEELLKAERFQKQKAKIKKVNAGKGKLQVSWKAVEGADGYVIEYAQKANFKGKKQVVVANGIKTSQKISKLKKKKKKTYYVRIRAYQENGSEKVYTRFSAKKKARTK